MSTEHITLSVNDIDHDLTLDSRVTLLDALRDHLHLQGTKKGCDHGLCGACTVLIDGERRVSCLVLAATTERRKIKTIEGVVGADGTLHPLQQAFIDHDAFQCGYCTPGQIMSILGAVEAGDIKTVSDVRGAMDNMCRCGAYDNIKSAIAQFLNEGNASEAGRSEDAA